MELNSLHSLIQRIRLRALQRVSVEMFSRAAEAIRIEVHRS